MAIAVKRGKWIFAQRTLVGNTSQTFVAECSSGFEGDSVSVTIEAGTYFSYDLAAANRKALNQARQQAISELVCTPLNPVDEGFDYALDFEFGGTAPTGQIPGFDNSFDFNIQ